MPVLYLSFKKKKKKKEGGSQSFYIRLIGLIKCSIVFISRTAFVVTLAQMFVTLPLPHKKK
jgi:hypothetical protein